MNKPVIPFQIHSELSDEIAYTLTVFAQYIGFKCTFINPDADITDNVVVVAEHGACDIRLSHFFSKHYLHKNFEHNIYFKKEPLHYTASGQPDYLSSCFYLLAFIQEYAEYYPDKYNRFPFSESVQYAFQCAEKNLVAEYFDKLYNSVPKISRQLNKQSAACRIFFTHDIDTLYGALRENAKPLLRTKRIGKLLQLIMHHYFRTPDYMMLDKIMQIENTYDVKSTFFWLVNNNKRGFGILDPDYSITDSKVQMLLQSVMDGGNVNGLHKSYSKKGYAEEYFVLRNYARPVNRNHYLQTELPQTFNALEADGIQLDSSMGFAETPGFRNSYGLPVRPFNVKTRKPYAFTEVPLTIMDATLRHYKKYDPQEAEKYILQFLEKNKINCVHTILWHNNYFFDYAEPGWLQVYKSVLAWIHDNKIQSVLPDDLII